MISGHSVTASFKGGAGWKVSRVFLELHGLCLVLIFGPGLFFFFFLVLQILPFLICRLAKGFDVLEFTKH